MSHNDNSKKDQASPALEARSGYPDLCLVIPCYNEEVVFPVLIERLEQFRESYPKNVRYLFIDNCSEDRTYLLMRDAAEKFEHAACIRMSRNFGHQASVTAGLKYAKGDAVAVIDADLQDPPELLLEMAERWSDGYDVVYGVRKERKESALKRFAYASFYRILQKLANIDIPLDSGDFSLMDRRVVDQLNAMPERNRFTRGLRGWVGYRQVGVSYERPSRHAGETKYNISSLMNLAMDGLLSFSRQPLRLASWAGGFMALLGFGLLVWTLVDTLIYGRQVAGWASLSVIVLLFGGIQLIILGIIGEYIGRIYDEVKQRPTFIVADREGWLADSSGEDQSS